MYKLIENNNLKGITQAELFSLCKLSRKILTSKLEKLINEFHIQSIPEMFGRTMTYRLIINQNNQNNNFDKGNL